MFGNISNAVGGAAGFLKDNINPNMLMGIILSKIPGEKAALVRKHAPEVLKNDSSVASMMRACEDMAVTFTGNPDAKGILQGIPLWAGLENVSKENMPSHVTKIAVEKGLFKK